MTTYAPSFSADAVSMLEGVVARLPHNIFGGDAIANPTTGQLWPLTRASREV